MAQHNISGNEAEDRAALHLKVEGFKILDRNWKTKFCEIDIVAKKDLRIYFVEVKYRSSTDQGGGFDYITAQKIHKMERAAQIWVQTNSWNGEYVLSAAEVSGPDFQINFLEEV